MSKSTWIVLALSVLLIGGCNSSGSSSSVSKENIYVRIFDPESQRSPATVSYTAESENTAPGTGEFAENQEPNVVANVDFDISEHVEVYRTPDFYGYYDPVKNAKKEGYGFEALSVLVESTATVNRYVYIIGAIDFSEGPLASFPLGTYTYRGHIEYYDPENDPKLDELKDEGTFEIKRTFLDPDAENSIRLDWKGDGVTRDDVNADLVIPAKKDQHDVTPLHDFTFSDTELGLKGVGSFHNEFGHVYGLFKSKNYAGGFKGDCGQSCPVSTQ